jgi:hypothetical protein
MNSKKNKVVECLNDFLSEAERSTKALQKELAVIRLERDIYKEMLVKEQRGCNTEYTKGSNVAYVTIYSRDNGEGADTCTCIGVFTRKSKALQAILDVCKKNDELSIDGFIIEEFDVGKELISDHIVNVLHFDEDAHCETSTTIVGIQCDVKPENHSQYYSVEYKVDKVYHIE